MLKVKTIALKYTCILINIFTSPTNLLFFFSQEGEEYLDFALGLGCAIHGAGKAVLRKGHIFGLGQAHSQYNTARSAVDTQRKAVKRTPQGQQERHPPSRHPSYSHQKDTKRCLSPPPAPHKPRHRPTVTPPPPTCVYIYIYI